MLARFISSLIFSLVVSLMLLSSFQSGMNLEGIYRLSPVEALVWDRDWSDLGAEFSRNDFGFLLVCSLVYLLLALLLFFIAKPLKRWNSILLPSVIGGGLFGIVAYFSFSYSSLVPGLSGQGMPTGIFPIDLIFWTIAAFCLLAFEKLLSHFLNKRIVKT